jgi:hypothetical protein
MSKSGLRQTMRRFEIRVLSIEWFLTILWIVVFGSLSYIAFTERSITLGGKGGFHHSDGLSAVIMGFILLGAALLGVGLLFSLHAFERLLQLLLFLGWLGSIIIYFAYFYP